MPVTLRKMFLPMANGSCSYATDEKSSIRPSARSRLLCSLKTPTAPVSGNSRLMDSRFHTRSPRPKWSPDGLKIISEMHDGRLFVVYPDGTGLTTIKLQTGTERYFAFEPHWSPDETRIIFCMYINGGEGIYTANPD